MDWSPCLLTKSDSVVFAVSARLITSFVDVSGGNSVTLEEARELFPSLRLPEIEFVAASDAIVCAVGRRRITSFASSCSVLSSRVSSLEQAPLGLGLNLLSVFTAETGDDSDDVLEELDPPYDR